MYYSCLFTILIDLLVFSLVFFFIILIVGFSPNSENNRKHFWGLLPNIVIRFMVIVCQGYLIPNIDFINKNKP
jgi:hypothetical protein